jgi:hypothetical protein
MIGVIGRRRGDVIHLYFPAFERMRFDTRGEPRPRISGDAQRTIFQRLKPRVMRSTSPAVADIGDEAFLKHVRPYHAVVFVNRDNVNGYPADSTMKLLREYSKNVRRTDVEGEICVEMVLEGGVRGCAAR